MTKTQEMLSDLKQVPMTGNELTERWGGTWTGQRHRLMKHGAIEKFQVANDNSAERFARLIVWKYRVIADYCPQHGRKPGDGKGVPRKNKNPPIKSIENAINLLTAHGYTVTAPIV